MQRLWEYGSETIAHDCLLSTHKHTHTHTHTQLQSCEASRRDHKALAFFYDGPKFSLSLTLRHTSIPAPLTPYPLSLQWTDRYHTGQITNKNIITARTTCTEKKWCKLICKVENKPTYQSQLMRSWPYMYENTDWAAAHRHAFDSQNGLISLYLQYGSEKHRQKNWLHGSPICNHLGNLSKRGTSTPLSAVITPTPPPTPPLNCPPASTLTGSTHR